MLWSIGFMVTFVIGGMTGVLLAVPPADFVLHNSLFLVAHFHNVIIGGVLFGAFAGYNYWFPKAFGFRLHEGLGKAAFWCWFIGFYLAFMPLYVLGLMGMTRRMQHYDVPAWHPWLLVAAVGAAVILAGIVLQVAQLVVSIRRREELRDTTGDPWNGRSLEWSTASPPPAFNFAVLPRRRGRGRLLGHEAARAQAGKARARSRAYADIEMPRNSADRLHLRLLRHLHGLRADLAHLVAGGRGRARRLRDLRRVRLAGPDRISSFRPTRSRASTGPTAAPAARRWHWRPRMSDAMSAFEGDGRPCIGRRPTGPAGRRRCEHAARDIASKRIIVGYGFWIFLLSDIVMFSAFFATYAVLVGRDRRRPEREGSVQPAQRRDRDRLPAAVQLHLRRRQHRRAGAPQRPWFYGGMAATALLGAAFLCLEIREFAGMIAQGAGPTRSAFLSAFFTLVGCHGLHVTARPAVAADHDGAGVRQGLPGRHSAARPVLQPVLAHAGHHLGRVVHRGLSDGSGANERYRTSACICMRATWRPATSGSTAARSPRAFAAI